MPSTATTVKEYLDELPAERRTVVTKVRDMITKRLPKGYRETVKSGMILYEIPLERYPKTYNGQPLQVAALAAQKNHYAVYLTSVYSDPEQEKALRKAFEAAGKKLDMGKSCVRFKSLDDIQLDAIGDVIASTPPDKFIERYEEIRKK